MYATNLAIVFGPSLIRAPAGPGSMAVNMNNLGQHQNIIKNYILQYHWFFDVDDQEGGDGEEANKDEDVDYYHGNEPHNEEAEIPEANTDQDDQAAGSSTISGDHYGVDDNRFSS
jgi:hypothetical protein